MRLHFILFLGLLILAQNALAYKTLNIDLDLSSFGGFVEGTQDIYVGSVLNYSIKLWSAQGFPSLSINVLIKNSNNEIIENKTHSVPITQANESRNINSSASTTEWRLIHADAPGIYKLIASIENNEEFHLLENKSSSFRHDKTLPFFFEVKSVEEKRIADRNEETQQENARQNAELKRQNDQMLSITWNSILISIAMLVVSLVQLFSTPEGRNTFLQFIRNVLISFVLIMLGIIIWILILIAAHP